VSSIVASKPSQAQLICLQTHTNACSHQLPDDVFVEGETRPTKPVKEKKKKKATGARAKSANPETKTNGTTSAITKMKRQFEGTGLEVRNPSIVEPPQRHHRPGG
jgi:poly(A) polymerase